MLKVFAKHKKAEITARVWRAKEQRWDSIGVIASTSKWWNFKQCIKRFFKNIFKKLTLKK